ncbi:MAG: iron-sulfur cluster assembly scaffold protein [Firmicutes bacterium]|nr:iron-sulfur cluster assembly scaffold protein [Bacillota bacterium]
MYNDKVLKAFTEAKHAGVIENADAVGQVGNASCGDIMKIYMRVEKGVITDAKFQTFGCAAAIASSSVACELVIGKTVEQAKKITNKQVLDVLGSLPAEKIHCSVLAEEAIEEALKAF